jgi:hypothetical protein
MPWLATGAVAQPWDGRMISGNQTWTGALTQLTKQPLYTFEIPDFGIIVASFSVAAASVTVGGYGIGLYGLGGYGT